MISPIIKGKVVNGKFKPVDKGLFMRTLSSFEGKECCVSVKAPRKGRSVEQNAYYWGVIIAILSDYSGETDVNRLHDQLLAMFAVPEVVSNRLQKDVVVQGRSSKMGTVEFENYASKIRVWAITEHGVDIPAPNEVGL